MRCVDLFLLTTRLHTALPTSAKPSSPLLWTWSCTGSIPLLPPLELPDLINLHYKYSVGGKLLRTNCSLPSAFPRYHLTSSRGQSFQTGSLDGDHRTRDSTSAPPSILCTIGSPTTDHLHCIRQNNTGMYASQRHFFPWGKLSFSRCFEATVLFADICSL